MPHLSKLLQLLGCAQVQVQCSFTSTETIRTIWGQGAQDGHPDLCPKWGGPSFHPQDGGPLQGGRTAQVMLQLTHLWPQFFAGHCLTERPPSLPAAPSPQPLLYAGSLRPEPWSASGGGGCPEATIKGSLQTHCFKWNTIHTSTLAKQCVAHQEKQNNHQQPRTWRLENIRNNALN